MLASMQYPLKCTVNLPRSSIISFRLWSKLFDALLKCTGYVFLAQFCQAIVGQMCLFDLLWCDKMAIWYGTGQIIKKTFALMKNIFWTSSIHVSYWYGACMGGSKSNAVNLILRLFLYHILHTMSSLHHESIHNSTNNQQTPPPWWWSRSPLQQREFNESTPPEGRAGLRIHFPRPLLKGLVKFIKLK